MGRGDGPGYEGSPKTGFTPFVVEQSGDDASDKSEQECADVMLIKAGDRILDLKVDSRGNFPK